MRSLILLLGVLFLACEQTSPGKADINPVQATIIKAQKHCGSSESMPWLEDLVLKGEEDKREMLHMGNYIGYISAVQVNGKRLFFTNFMMGSGGIAHYVYDCKGEIPDFSQLSIPSLDYIRRNIIYTNIEE